MQDITQKAVLVKLSIGMPFSVDFQPVPSGADFRIDLGELSQMQFELDARVSTAVQSAQSELWERLAAPLRAMSEKLKDPEGKFRNSLVGNLIEIADLIPALNLTGDKNLQSFSEEVKSSLASLSPDTLRTDIAVRQEAAKKSQEILDRMSGYLTPATEIAA